MSRAFPQTVRAELVEAVSFFFDAGEKSTTLRQARRDRIDGGHISPARSADYGTVTPLVRPFDDGAVELVED